MSNLREASKANYSTDNIKPTDQEIQTGALQRIADVITRMKKKSK